MKLSLLACVVLPLVVASAKPVAEIQQRRGANMTTLACNALKQAFSSQVFVPGDANYTTQNEGETRSTGPIREESPP